MNWSETKRKENNLCGLDEIDLTWDTSLFSPDVYQSIIGKFQFLQKKKVISVWLLLLEYETPKDYSRSQPLHLKVSTVLIGFNMMSLFPRHAGEKLIFARNFESRFLCNTLVSLPSKSCAYYRFYNELWCGCFHAVCILVFISMMFLILQLHIRY